MPPVLEFSVSDERIGLTIRSVRNGPENDFARGFLYQYLEMLKTKKQHYALFYEPFIPTGFPDIVLATYNPKVLDDWNHYRSQLTVMDFKLLHHLYNVRGSKAEEIELQLGVDSKALVRSLERLLTSKLIRWYAKKWVPRDLRNQYAITNIVAIEVKMKNWQDAFCQASMNHWFASESYVLFPTQKPNQQILKQSKKLGVGIFSMPINRKPRKICSSIRQKLPSSYASWLFNEWIGRRLYSEGKE